MKTTTLEILNELLNRHEKLASCRDDILGAYSLMERAFKNGKKLLVCGNGGSASDSEHIVGELMKCFKKKREISAEIYTALGEYGEDGEVLRGHLEGALPAVALTSHLSLSTAFANDAEPSLVFAQQLYGLGNEGDVLLTLSTSGNSKNCVLAATVAKAKGISTVALTGERESKLSAICDVTVRVGAVETYLVQEYHLPVYHALCAMLEEEFF